MFVHKTQLLLFIIAVIGIGSLIGISFPTGDWYLSLEKPWFTPPGWLFGPVWTLLYAFIAIAGWRNFYRPSDPLLKPLWLLQMILNFAWSPAFFGAQSPGLALIIISALLLSIIAYLIRTKEADRICFMLFVPYLLWVGFATCLNLAIFLLN